MDRYYRDSTFIKILDDSTMRETIKKVKSSFVFFHADHQRLSDVAYMHYVNISEKYKSLANFYVVPASVGADVSRTYSVPGNPSLLYFKYGTKTSIHYGMFSKTSIEAFIANWTSPILKEIAIPSDSKANEVYSAIYSSVPDRATAVVLFCDNSTKFGRAAFTMSEELGPYFSFVWVKEPKIAETLNIRFPSLMVIRTEDYQQSLYTGEPDSDEMFIWVQHNSVPQFKKLSLEQLFSPDGVSVRSAIAIVDENNEDQSDIAFRTLGKMSSSQNWIRMFYADFAESRAFAKLFGVTQIPSLVYLSANYTHLQYHISNITDESSFTAFYEDKLEMKTTKTPPTMYKEMRPVTEFAFEKMSEEGPFFTLFTSAFCVKCKTLKTAAFDAAQTIRRNGGLINWALWDVTQSTPSFQKNISVGIPSVWFFPSSNVSEGIAYNGPQHFLSIVEWVHGKFPDRFDLDQIMSNELGTRFDEI